MTLDTFCKSGSYYHLLMNNIHREFAQYAFKLAKNNSLFIKCSYLHLVRMQNGNANRPSFTSNLFYKLNFQLRMVAMLLVTCTLYVYLLRQQWWYIYIYIPIALDLITVIIILYHESNDNCVKHDHWELLNPWVHMYLFTLYSRLWWQMVECEPKSHWHLSGLYKDKTPGLFVIILACSVQLPSAHCVL